MFFRRDSLNQSVKRLQRTLLQENAPQHTLWWRAKRVGVGLRGLLWATIEEDDLQWAVGPLLISSAAPALVRGGAVDILCPHLPGWTPDFSWWLIVNLTSLLLPHLP